jgi:hypothetical protein
VCVQERVLQARKLNATKRQELLFKRMAALQEVLEGARPLVRALKEERKARVSIQCWAGLHLRGTRFFCSPASIAWLSTS